MQGSIGLNGITDDALIKILQTKERHAGQLLFNPQQMQPTNQAGTQVYNNVVLNWTSKEALSGVIEILQHIHSS